MTEIEKLMREYFEAFNRHDAEGMIALMAEDVVHDLNEGGREVGTEAFRRFKAHMDNCYRERVRDLVFMVGGDTGTTEFIVEGEYLQTDGDLPPATGQKYGIPAAAIFEQREGKITRITSYYNLQGWIAAIGG